MVPDYTVIATRRTGDGMAFELFCEAFALPCNHLIFRGRYDLWPFCKPYDAEEWWEFMEEAEAKDAAKALTEYLREVPRRFSPERISFVQEGSTFHLRNNGHICGPHLYRGETDSNLWPFNKLPNWTQHKTREDALKACLRLQAYLDGRGEKKAKSKSKKK